MTASNPSVTFGLSTVGNPQGLLLCLSSVLLGTVKPAQIMLRFEGKLPDFDQFYLAQLASLASLYGVGFSIHYEASRGVRHARDWMLSNCKTEHLWMGDDDAVYHPGCLMNFLEAMRRAKTDHVLPSELAYLSGSKFDVNNRRGYADFKLEPHSGPVDEWTSQNFVYQPGPSYVRTHALDTGNALFNLKLCRAHQLVFSLFEDSANAGGEDTLFALQCEAKQLARIFVPGAIAIHLEKPRVRFNEDAARLEMVLRACDSLNFDKEVAKRILFPWLSPQVPKP